MNTKIDKASPPSNEVQSGEIKRRIMSRLQEEVDEEGITAGYYVKGDFGKGDNADYEKGGYVKEQ